jgi:hypothetical protein
MTLGSPEPAHCQGPPLCDVYYFEPLALPTHRQLLLAPEDTAPSER